MKLLVLIFGLSIAAFAGEPPTCLIIRHASTSHQAFVSGASWQYVEGDFPKGIKFRSNIRDNAVRKVKELGGLVFTVPTIYTPADLEDARNQCKLGVAK